MAISEQWAYLLEPGLRTIFNVQRDALAAASKIPMLFGAGTSSKAVEYFLGMGGMGDWAEYKGAIEYDDMEQGWRTTLTNVPYVKGFQIERELVDDDQYNVINQRPANLAISAMRTREKHAASVFNNAFSGSYLGGDAIALCGAHPYSPGNATTQANNGTTALSYAAVDSTRQLMRAFVDDRGELVSVMPDTLLVPPELEETAWAIWRTTNKVDTADAHANFISGFVRQVVVWDYLTDANNWFLIDSTLAKQQLHWLDRIPLEFAMDPTSDFNLVAKYRGYMRYTYGWSDFRWVYGHAVT